MEVSDDLISKGCPRGHQALLASSLDELPAQQLGTAEVQRGKGTIQPWHQERSDSFLGCFSKLKTVHRVISRAKQKPSESQWPKSNVLITQILRNIEGKIL